MKISHTSSTLALSTVSMDTGHGTSPEPTMHPVNPLPSVGKQISTCEEETRQSVVGTSCFPFDSKQLFTVAHSLNQVCCESGVLLVAPYRCLTLLLSKTTKHRKEVKEQKQQTQQPTSSHWGALFMSSTASTLNASMMGTEHRSLLRRIPDTARMIRARWWNSPKIKKARLSQPYCRW